MKKEKVSLQGMEHLKQYTEQKEIKKGTDENHYKVFNSDLIKVVVLASALMLILGILTYLDVKTNYLDTLAQQIISNFIQ